VNVNEAVQRLVETIQNASPAIWQAAYRQARIDAWENLALVAALAVAAIVLWRLPRKLLRSNGDVELLIALVWVGSAICVVLAVFSALAFADNTFNPTFAAIKEITSLVKP
jgi:succinate dehydrogenase hydrophobic anchor subunit